MDRVGFGEKWMWIRILLPLPDLGLGSAKCLLPPQRLTVALVSSTADLASVCPHLLSPTAVAILLRADDTRGRCNAHSLWRESYFPIGILTKTRPSGACT